MSEQLVALSPSDVPAAQSSLTVWCQNTIVQLGRELREQRENLRIAKRAKWKHTGWLSQITRTKARMIYYTKIKAAVAAGYLVVPNMDVDVIACRVDRSRPQWKTESYDSYRLSHTSPELLPAGDGRYVNGAVDVEHSSYKVDDPKNQGQKKTVEQYTRRGYIEAIDFPIKLIKPQILEATERALALKIFDRIGIVKHRRKSDPFVLGQLINPLSTDRVVSPLVVSFFIAWWLNPEDL